MDTDDEDNNPFIGTDHFFALGIDGGSLRHGDDDFLDSAGTIQDTTTNKNNNNKKKKSHHEKYSKSTDYELNHDSTNNNTNKVAFLDDNDIIDKGSTHNLLSGFTSPSENDSSTGGSLTADTDESIKESAVPQHYEPYVSLSMSMTSPKRDHKLFENINRNIQILDAGDYRDPWGKHAIGYNIRCDDGMEVVRRYSEFDTLRQGLLRLFPTVVIPPIPSKHPLIKYLLHPISAENDKKIIEKRKRLLQSFLNHCNMIPEIKDNIVFKKFLNPEYSIKDIVTTPPMSILPTNNLIAPPLTPTKPSPLHLLLPAPNSISRLDSAELQSKNVQYSKMNTTDETINIEKNFAHIEVLCTKHKVRLRGMLKIIKHHKNHVHSMYSTLSDLGANYNIFSLENNIIATPSNKNSIKLLSNGIEKIGNAFDVEYLTIEILNGNIQAIMEEPLEEFIHLLESAQDVLNFRKLKKLQFQIIKQTINTKENRIKCLKEVNSQLRRSKKNSDSDSNSPSRSLQNSTLTKSNSIQNNSDVNINDTNDKNSLLTTNTTSELTPSSPEEIISFDETDEVISIPGSTNDSLTTKQINIPPDTNINNRQNHSSKSNRNILTNNILMNSRRKNRQTKRGTIPPHLLTEAERQFEIGCLEKEITKLNQCYELVSKDLDDINKSSYTSLKNNLEYIEMKWNIMIKEIVRSVLTWIRSCLENWKKAKEAVNQISTNNLLA
ncbi:hypothetical protein TBLA_0D01610 [Henningerozyma blattae CBS 6284]|uniref:PX domain-containing protein n=1 Tax=Henningerozyma blattae (strain ATCC 34711 / CBS 6284 / DSM 70876 / NBRC 10599 / NRRL Y-10934 / UCD 77-7) TaxID=1071380 RepID=I2H2R7_HENB6|nr:hypothetical protein TBLA_0D01610 [Tetrapisispora blattae CBS 6284]CCH60669.1 hypothetical protein TBLA_0D01610 [Tetrapisispora blattae CBS 6284]